MNIIKLCIWMNIPSHHQSAFFQALAEREDVDLAVRYFSGVDEQRIQQGWEAVPQMRSYECVVGANVPDVLNSLPDWRSRIHIIALSFSPQLVAYFIKEKVCWCHWSEMPGIRLAQLFHFNHFLFLMTEYFSRIYRHREAFLLNNYAFCAFAQGELAVRALVRCGVKRSKMDQLYYSPAALPKRLPEAEIVDFAAGRKIFLVAGALCDRKGTDVILGAFKMLLPCPDWVLVFCGKELGKRSYPAMVRRMGLENQVLFLGTRPAMEMAGVFAAGNVLIQMSRFDGWGAVLNEAASCGLPIIASVMTGAAWHLVRPGFNGFRVALRRSALAEAMAAYVKDSQLRAEHGANSRILFYKEFTPKQNAERLVKCLKKRLDA